MVKNFAGACAGGNSTGVACDGLCPSAAHAGNLPLIDSPAAVTMIMARRTNFQHRVMFDVSVVGGVSRVFSRAIFCPSPLSAGRGRGGALKGACDVLWSGGGG